MTDYIRTVQHRTQYADHVADELQQCGSYLVFRHYMTDQKARLVAARTCKKHLLCPFCAIRRGAKMYARYIERIKIVMEENPHLVPWMVNLTVKNGPDLGERYRHLHSNVKALNKNRTRGDRGHEVEKAEGLVWSYEFKRGENSHLWHPHSHAIWLCSAPIDSEKLSAEWHHLTGDSFIVEAHQMYGETFDACAEVFKYAVKFQDLPLHDNLEAFCLLRGKRLVRSAGLLWGVNVPDTLDDELEDPYWMDFAYRYLPNPATYEICGKLMQSPAMQTAA